MNITTTLNPTVSWDAFARSPMTGEVAVPREIIERFPEGSNLPKQEVGLFSYGTNKISSVSVLLIPALQAIFGDDHKKCAYPELVGSIFFFEGEQYYLGYTNDPEEHVYGWYIIVL